MGSRAKAWRRWLDRVGAALRGAGPHDRCPERRRAPGRAVAAGAALGAALVAPLAARPTPQDGEALPSLDLTAAEGTLRNNGFVPVDEAAAEHFAAADELWHAGDTAGALDRWRQAVADSATGALVPWIPSAAPPDAEAAPPRAFEGVEEALIARLELWPEALESWRERFESTAEAEFRAAAGSSAALAGLERRMPATSGALRAALVLGDRAFESGAQLAARTWYERGARHAAALGDEGLRAAVDARLLASQPPASRSSSSPPATALADPRAVELLDEVGPPPPFPGQPLAAGMRAGAVALDERTLLVQTASRLHVIDLEQAALIATIEPGALIADSLGLPPRAYPAESPPGWALLPDAEGGQVLCAVGRATPGRGRGNALVSLDPFTTRPDGARASTVPRLRWAVVDDRLRDGAGEVRTPALLEAWDNVEFQPGPALAGELALAQTRRGSGDIEAHLVAFDRASGEPLWERLIVKGGELAPDRGRFSGSDSSRGAGSPLLVCGNTVLVSTQLGAAALVDALDGRVRWSILNRRRSAEDRGWTGSRTVSTPDARRVAWAPADGDFLYWLPAGPLPRGAEHPFLADPAPIGAARSLQAALRGSAVLVLARSGSRATVARWDGATGARSETLHLLPGEPFREGLGLAGERLIASSDRALYLFDLSRDLLLLDRVALSAPGVAPAGRWAGGGAVLIVGDRVAVVGHDHVELFQLR